MEELHRVLTDLYSSIRCVQLNLIEKDSQKTVFQLPQNADKDYALQSKIFAICMQANAVCSDSESLNQIMLETGDLTHFVKWINEGYMVHLVGETKGINVGKYNALLGLIKSRISRD